MDFFGNENDREFNLVMNRKVLEVISWCAAKYDERTVVTDHEVEYLRKIVFLFLCEHIGAFPNEFPQKRCDPA